MEENKHKHLQELLEDFDTVMLITRHGEREHARPMAVASVEGPTVVWFLTSEESPKADELRKDSFAAITAQAGRKFVALSGRAELLRDRAKLDELWNEAWKVWFPGGKEDPSLCLIRVVVDDAEYWDSSGLKGIRYALEAARAYVTGETPAPAPGQHGRIIASHARPADR
ncbi:MAG: pyridoxamine 5'-phosphate oxidase family protein [Myxococcota bacterium]|nr:pyridoxamine 5'-phosphate oxidase family protein [Myxococcota bacterium]